MKPISTSAVVGSRTKSALTWVVSIALVLCLVSPLAYADIIPATFGFGWPNDAVKFVMVDARDANNNPIRKEVPVPCFQSSFSLMINMCNDGDHTLVIPLYVRDAGDHRVTVRARGGGPFGPTKCEAYANDPIHNQKWQNPDSPPPMGFNTADTGIETTSDLKDLDLGVLAVPGHCTLQVECSVPPGGAVFSVNFRGA